MKQYSSAVLVIGTVVIALFTFAAAYFLGSGGR